MPLGAPSSNGSLCKDAIHEQKAPSIHKGCFHLEDEAPDSGCSSQIETQYSLGKMVAFNNYQDNAFEKQEK